MKHGTFATRHGAVHLVTCVVAALAWAGTAWAGETSKESKATAPAETRIKFSGSLDVGFTYNPDHNASRQNFGRLFDDRQNEVLLNQLILTVERALVPEGFDWGFKFQGMFGSDARYIHTFSVFDNTMNELHQPDLVEGYFNFHLPIVTPGGIDLKVGQFVTLEGAEVINSTGNFFYSHSMLFNFGIPLKHNGIMVTTHATKWLDLHTGVVRGVNAGASDNNDAVSFHGGVGLNLLDGKLTILGSTSIGPENDAINEEFDVETNGDLRLLHSLVAIWKITDKWTATVDLNYGEDNGFDAEWYGAAHYLTYAVNDWLTLGARGEIWRDDDGFAVLQSGNNEDFVKLQRGIFDHVDPMTKFGSDSTYVGTTVGANIKIPGLPKCLTGLVIRPELRYDTALGGSARYNDDAEKNQFTVGIDAILTF